MPYIGLENGTLWYAARTVTQVLHPPVLLVHGAGGSHLDWPAQLRRLPGVSTYAPDLPGHGRSSPPGRLSVAAYAEAMNTLLDGLSIDRVIIAGHSMGGAIALAMALHWPERIAGIVVIAAAARFPVPEGLSGQEAPGEREMTSLWQEQLLTASLAQPAGGNRRYSAAVDPVTLQGDLAAVRAFDVTADVSQINVPALIISGANDQLVPPALSEELAQALPQAEFVPVRGAGHMVTLEQSLVVADAVVNWLVRLPQSRK